MHVDAPDSIAAPEKVDRRSSPAGLRAVASFEAFKGALVVLLGILLLIYHSRADTVTGSLLHHLHVSTDARIGRAIMRGASRLTDARWLTIAGVALGYSSLRFTEAWGLWNRRVWAEWFALLSGAAYLPFELAEAAHRPSAAHFAVLILNLIIVAYMAYIRIRENKEKLAMR